MASRSRTKFRKWYNGCTFLTCATVTYALVNPERTNFMDIMPIYRQRHYAIIAKFDLQYCHHKDFEFFMKDTIRYYQQQTGAP